MEVGMDVPEATNMSVDVAEQVEVVVNNKKDINKLKKYGKSSKQKTKPAPTSRSSKSRIFKEVKERLKILSEGAFQGNFILYSHFPNPKRPFNFAKSYGDFAKQFHTANKAQSITFSTFITAAWKDKMASTENSGPSFETSESNGNKENNPQAAQHTVSLDVNNESQDSLNDLSVSNHS